MLEAPRQRPESQLFPSVAVALSGAVWGCYWYPLRTFVNLGIGSVWVAIAFNLSAITILLPKIWRDRTLHNFPRQMWTGLLLGTAFTFYTISLDLTDVLHAILLFYLTPVWSTLGEWIFSNRRLTLRRIVALVLGLGGMFFVLAKGQHVPLPRNPGDVVALTSGLFWSLGTMRSFRRPSADIAMPAFTFAIGGLISALIILVIASALSLPLAQPGPFVSALPSLFLLALTIFVPPTILVLWAAQRVDAGRIGVLLTTEVLVGVVSAALFAGEPFGLTEALGTVMIVGAALIEVTGNG